MLGLIEFRTELDVDGISLANFARLENLNTAPWSPDFLRICPEISAYRGVALNLFRGKIYKPPHESIEIYLFPKWLSVHSNDCRYYQIDLITNNRDFWPENEPEPTRNHVLCITRLPRLCQRRGNPILRHRKRDFVCRQCLKLFEYLNEQERHSQSCQGFPRGRFFQPRRSLNQRIYKTFKFNHFTKQMERNSIKFNTGELFKTLRPLSTSVIDFESLSTPLVSDDPRLKDLQPCASIEQTPLSYSLLHASNYENFPLILPSQI